MARLLLTLSALAVLLVGCNATSSVKLSSIMPPKLSVNLTYMIDNQMVALTSPCTAQAPGSSCLPVVQAKRDSVMIKYAVMPQYQANTSDTVLLKACYSNFSAVDRPWRAANDVIALSKRCPFTIKSGLNPSSGNATWMVPDTVPIGTYFIRALVYAKNATDANSPIAVAVGNSAGYFQVHPINTREKGLVVAAGICICVGPILFTCLMLWEFKFSKKRV